MEGACLEKLRTPLPLSNSRSEEVSLDRQQHRNQVFLEEHQLCSQLREEGYSEPVNLASLNHLPDFLADNPLRLNLPLDFLAASLLRLNLLLDFLAASLLRLNLLLDFLAASLLRLSHLQDFSVVRSPHSHRPVFSAASSPLNHLPDFLEERNLLSPSKMVYQLTSMPPPNNLANLCKLTKVMIFTTCEGFGRTR